MAVCMLEVCSLVWLLSLCGFTESYYVHAESLVMAFQATDFGRSWGQLGPGNSTHQHTVSEGSAHAGLRQRLESQDWLQTVSGRYETDVWIAEAEIIQCSCSIRCCYCINQMESVSLQSATVKSSINNSTLWINDNCGNDCGKVYVLCFCVFELTACCSFLSNSVYLLVWSICY